MKLEVTAPDGSCDPEVLKNVILAVAPTARVKVFTPIDAVLPSATKLSDADVALMRLAQAIAEAVRQAPAEASWKSPPSFLLGLLVGDNTFEMSEGSAKDCPRAEAIAFSRYMKRTGLFKDYESPAQSLADHRRLYFPGGGYKGVKYTPTALGRAVYELLKDELWPHTIIKSE
jgi:hypothetical protein